MPKLRPTRRQKVRHLFTGCWSTPRPMFGGHVWTARHCPVCGRYPVGHWRLGDPVGKKD